MKTLQGKYALITGAAGGIGRLLAELFAKNKVNLILTDINEEQLQEVTRNLSESYKSISIESKVLDITKEKEVLDLASKITSLDILINNAGVAYGGSFENSRLDELSKTIEVNLLGTMKLTHALISKLKQGGGQIVNVASGAGLVGTSGMVTYSSSKFGLVGFTEALRGELKDENIGVSVVCPAFVKTDLIANSLIDKDRPVEKLESMVEKEGVKPELVAQTILKAVKTNRAIIKVGSLTKAGSLIKRISPALARVINVANYRKLKKNEIIE